MNDRIRVEARTAAGFAHQALSADTHPDAREVVHAAILALQSWLDADQAAATGEE